MVLKRLLPYFRAKSEEVRLALDYRKLMECGKGVPVSEEVIAQRAAYSWALRDIKRGIYECLALSSTGEVDL